MKKRKPIGMAFHWLLPQPFGAEAERSVLAPNDPMRYTHYPDDSSSMYFDLTKSDKEGLTLPLNMPYEVQYAKLTDVSWLCRTMNGTLLQGGRILLSL